MSSHTHPKIWNKIFPCFLISFFLSIFLISSPFASSATTQTNLTWPKQITQDGKTLILYQPQIDSWKDQRELNGALAFSISPKKGEANLGVIRFQALTDANTETHQVLIHNLQISQIDFPSLEAAKAQPLKDLTQQLFPKRDINLSLDRLVAAVKKNESKIQAVAVKTDPPPILVSTYPAILLWTDGEPLKIPVEGTSSLEFVANTNWTLLYDKPSSKYFLLANENWLSSNTLQGPWTRVTQLPDAFSKIPNNKDWEDVLKEIPPKSVQNATVPRVLFSKAPAELIQFEGSPAYTTIPETNLSFASNTKSNLFFDHQDKNFYFLTSGRWFRTANLGTGWSYAGNDLPADFKNIPADSPKADVLASVPGTREAEEAVLLAQVPTTVVVNKSEAEGKAKASYVGTPQFKPIEGTSLQYAANSSDKVIQIGKQYYLCENAVWFVSNAPQGPWKVADSIPKEIYQIPPSSPLYNVTYVTQNSTAANTVESSYTAGYLGTFLLGSGLGAAVTYGTGYSYPPYWGGGFYNPYPYTYGFGAFYNPWIAGYGYGGGYYGPYARWGGAGWYNPNTGTYGRAATMQTANGTRTVAAGYNPWTGAYGATRQGSGPYGQWGSSVASKNGNWAKTEHVSTAEGSAFHYQTSTGKSGTAVRTPQGSVAKTPNNVYAGRDGNVYRKNSDGSWQKYNQKSWQSVNPSKTQTRAEAQPGEPRATYQHKSAMRDRPASDLDRSSVNHLQQEDRGRQMGAQRESNFQNFSRGGGFEGRGFGGGGFGGGGRGFGGGGRGGRR